MPDTHLVCCEDWWLVQISNDIIYLCCIINNCLNIIARFYVTNYLDTDFNLPTYNV